MDLLGVQFGVFMSLEFRKSYLYTSLNLFGNIKENEDKKKQRERLCFGIRLHFTNPPTFHFDAAEGSRHVREVGND